MAALGQPQMVQRNTCIAQIAGHRWPSRKVFAMHAPATQHHVRRLGGLQHDGGILGAFRFGRSAQIARGGGAKGKQEGQSGGTINHVRTPSGEKICFDYNNGKPC